MNMSNRKARALEPKAFYCNLTKRNISALVEYSDYKHRNQKGEPGTIYCEHIIECYHNKERCRYSGISPSYPDPLGPPRENPDPAGEDEKEENE